MNCYLRKRLSKFYFNYSNHFISAFSNSALNILLIIFSYRIQDGQNNIEALTVEAKRLQICISELETVNQVS